MNLLMCSDLTLALSLKVKRGETNLKVLIIGPTGLKCETNLWESCARSLLMRSDLTLGPSFKAK